MATTDRQRSLDQSILDDARAQREHDQELARIAAQRDQRIAAHRAEAAESRHIMLGVVTGILAVLALLLAISLIWKSNVDADRERRERQTQRDDAVAELCIERGNLWVDGNCLIATREQP